MALGGSIFYEAVDAPSGNPDTNGPTQRYFRTAGSLGWGFPAALGVKCALPDRPVVCFTGDGGFYYHIAELETARRHNINAVIVVNNNSALNQEIKLNDAAYGGKQRGRAEEMWRFPEVNFAKIAEGFGCAGTNGLRSSSASTAAVSSPSNGARRPTCQLVLLVSHLLVG